jgi:signal transduction histidine kinase/CHASE2 domain-containing sensor protein
MRKLWHHFIKTDTLLLAVLLISTTLLLAHQGILNGFDQYLYDVQIRIFKRPASTDIVLVTIDEESLNKLGRWKLPEKERGKLLRKLSEQNPRSISYGFEIPSYTDRLHESVNKPVPVQNGSMHGNIASNSIRQSETQIASEQPGSGITPSPAWHVNIDLIQDADGIVRSVYQTGGTIPANWDHQYLILTGKKVIKSGIKETDSDIISKSYRHGLNKQMNARVYIPYTGPPGHYPRIPYHRLLNAETPPDVLRDKYIIVGMTAEGMGHSFPVPDYGFADPMDDLEIIANVLDAFLHGNYIKPVQSIWYLAYSGAFALIPFLLFTFFTPRMNIVVTILLVATVLSISMLLVAVFHLWLPPAAALTAVVVSYLMWSSRRLQNAVNYLDMELAHINAEMAGREVDITTRLGSAFNFLENVLPMSGWYIADVDGTIKYTCGHKPRLSAVVMTPGNWIQDGNQYWTSIVDNQKKLDVGIRWSSPDGPLEEEKAFVDTFLEQFTGNTQHTEHEAIEVVNKLIVQVKNAIISMRTMHQFFDDCIAQMADGLLVTNEFGKVLFANERAAVYLQGHTINNPAGKGIFQLVKNLESSGSENVKELLRKAYLERMPVCTNAGNREGQELLLQITPMLRGKTGTAGIIITLSDISYLRAIERARNETISFVSHDLRSPLVSILALLEMVKTSQSREELDKLHKRIGEYTQLTISMAEQFIQLTRVESDAEIKLDVIDLVSTAINAFEQVWVQAQSKRISLVRNIDLDHAWVNGESGLLERAIINLLNNAIKFSREGKTVRMSLFRDDGNICCSIEDQGYGISNQEIPNLFDRFHRAHRNKGVDEHGIGLGLALVKATAERHGGDIQVVSSQGKGSRFCLRIPEISIKEKISYEREKLDTEYHADPGFRKAL